jgi:hypothetical protein
VVVSGFAMEHSGSKLREVRSPPQWSYVVPSAPFALCRSQYSQMGTEMLLEPVFRYSVPICWCMCIARDIALFCEVHVGFAKLETWSHASIKNPKLHQNRFAVFPWYHYRFWLFGAVLASFIINALHLAWLHVPKLNKIVRGFQPGDVKVELSVKFLKIAVVNLG